MGRVRGDGPQPTQKQASAALRRVRNPRATSRAKPKPIKLDLNVGTFETPRNPSKQSHLLRVPDLEHFTDEQRNFIIGEQLKRLKPLRLQALEVIDEKTRAETPTRELAAMVDDVLAKNLSSDDAKALKQLQRVGKRQAITKNARAFRKVTGATKKGASELAQDRAWRQAMTSLAAQHKAKTGSSYAEVKALPEGKKSTYSGTTSVLGVKVPGLHQTLHFADQILDKFERPVNFVAGAAYAAHQGEPILKTAANSFLHKKGETKTFSDVLDAKGVTGATKFIAGLGGDVIFNPLNLVSAGVSAPAKAAVETASRLSSQARELRAAGDVAQAVKLEAKAAKAAQRATKLSSNKGVQVGVRVGAGGKELKLMTSGELSARTLKALGLSKVATQIRETPVVQAAGKALSPSFRSLEHGTEQEHAAYRQLHREARATTSQGSKQWERRARAYVKELRSAAKQLGLTTKEAHEQVLAALERAPKDALGPRVPVLGEAGGGTHSIHGLPKPLRQVAVTLRSDFKAIGEAELDANVLGAVRDLYVPHHLTKAAERLKRVTDRGRSNSAKANPYALRRADRRSIGEVNAELVQRGLEPMFETNVGRLVAERGTKSAQVMANRDFAEGVVDEAGRKLKFKVDANGVPRPLLDELRPIDEVYVLGRKTAANPTGFRHIARNEGTIVRTASELKQGERFVVLPKGIGHGVLQGGIRAAAKDDLGILHTYDRALGAIKSTLTVLNVPAYDMRNLAGDLWNAHLADTDAKSLYDGVKIITARTRRNMSVARDLGPDREVAGQVTLHHGLKVDRDDFIREMERGNVIDQGYYGSELREHGEHAPARLRKPGLVEGARRVGNFREDTVRAGTYLSARRRGMTPTEAAEWTNRHHFDYGDLTDFERNALRRIFPFWTFASRNTQLQASKLLARPGKFSNYALAQEEARKQADLPERWQLDLPDYARRGLPIPIKVGGKRVLLSPQLPITDLNRITSVSSPTEEFHQATQMLTPMAKWALEPLLNYSFFFRDPVFQDADHPDAPHYVNAPWYVGALPRPARVMLAGGNEDAADKGFITSKVDYALRLLPQQNFAAQVGSAGVGSRNQTSSQALLSQLTGVKINQYPSLKKRQTDATWAQVDRLQAQLDDLKKLGKKNTAHYKQLDRQRRALLDKLYPPKSRSRGHAFGSRGASGATYGSSSVGSGTFGTSGSNSYFGSGR